MTTARPAPSCGLTVAAQPTATPSSGRAAESHDPERPRTDVPRPSVGAVDLAAWMDQQPGNAPLTSNQEAAGVPFQRWFRFKEAFSPRFVAEALGSLPVPPTRCLDPFGGSGTTALTCQFLGIHPSVVEVNPFLADLIEAKLASYDVDRLLASRVRLASLVAKPRSDAAALRSRTAKGSRAAGDRRLFPGAPETFVEPGRDGRWVFDASVASRVAEYRDAIAALDDETARRLFRVLLGSVLVSVSNVVISGKARRYRRPSRRHVARAVDVDLQFDAAFQRAFFDICRFGARQEPSYVVLRGDARTRITEAEPVDVVLCSPPYPNSFDYTDIYNLELWALGYLASSADNRALRNSTLRSHVQIKGRFSAAELPSAALTRALERLENARERLWDGDIPAMVRAYFADMTQVLRSSRDRLAAAHGRILLVVGDSRYAGVDVPVCDILRELAPSVGLECVNARSVRSMRASAQQGGTYDLSESLLVLAPA